MSTALQDLNQSALVTRVSDIAKHSLADAAVTRAVEASRGTVGLVISDDEAAAAVVDRAKTIKAGMKALKDWEARLLALPKALEAAVRAVTGPAYLALDAGYKALSNANTAYGIKKEREAAEHQRKLQEAAEREKREAAARQAELDRLAAEAVTPEQRAQAQAAADEAADVPAVVVPMGAPPPPALVRGETGASTIVHRRKVELVDSLAYASVDPAGLGLTKEAEQVALARFRRWDAADERPEGAASDARGGFVLNGLRYYTEAGSSFR